jgi:hypothetical protein
MSFFHKKNVTKCLGHNYAIWTSDSIFQKIFGPAKKRLVLISGTVKQYTSKKVKETMLGHLKFPFCLKLLLPTFSKGILNNSLSMNHVVLEKTEM